MSELNIVIAGVGGQGTVLASRLIAESALDAGFFVRGSETIGMAQRGGSVLSHIRLGQNEGEKLVDKQTRSPLVPIGKADVLIGFEPAEAARAAPRLKQNGFLFVSNLAVKVSGNSYDCAPILNYLKSLTPNFTEVDGNELSSRYGTRCLNVALLGMALKKGVFPFGAQAVEKTIKNRLAQKFWEKNIAALYAELP